MAGVDPYSPCPCGSGQKFKWCCHKVESYADKSQRLIEAGQVEAALEVIDEGLLKERDNPWLLTRKALILARAGRPDDAIAALRQVVAAQPKHIGAQMLLTRFVLDTEGGAAGAAQFQEILSAMPAEMIGSLAPLARIVGMVLIESGDFPAARKHLELALALGKDEDGAILSALRSMLRSPSVTPWLKNPDRLSEPPAEASGDGRLRFEQALGYVTRGLWSAAAATFETLSDDPVLGPAAERNAGFCRLWLADEAAAVSALRRHARSLGETEEAVDLEALCQQVEPPSAEREVERVQLIWPLRDQNKLLGTLRALGDIHEEGSGPIDPDDEKSPVVDQFALLDRPAAVEGPRDQLRPDQIPRILGRLLVGTEIVALESYDDGRLDALSQRFTNLAGAAIAPAHPRTKVLGKVDRSTLALSWEWLLPEGVDRPNAERLEREQRAVVLRDLWPTIPMKTLGGKSPLQAATTGRHQVPLRAALAILDQDRDASLNADLLSELRTRLGVKAEPEVDPETVDIETLHAARLHLVPAARLSDEALVALYRRARSLMISRALRNSALALVDRPALWERDGLSAIAIFTDLASVASNEGDFAAAFGWVNRGRAADSPSKRALNAPLWDMFEIQLKTRTQSPEEWVPELAVVLDRYGDNQQANQTILLGLMEMGLVQAVPHPERSGEIMLDSRGLQMLMSRFGPKVTTASGRLGVSATKPEIWTPGSGSGGGEGGLWTPGSGAGQPGASGDKPKLIIPGR